MAAAADPSPPTKLSKAAAPAAKQSRCSRRLFSQPSFAYEAQQPLSVEVAAHHAAARQRQRVDVARARRGLQVQHSSRMTVNVHALVLVMLLSCCCCCRRRHAIALCLTAASIVLTVMPGPRPKTQASVAALSDDRALRSLKALQLQAQVHAHGRMSDVAPLTSCGRG